MLKYTIILLSLLVSCAGNPYKSEEIKNEHIAEGCGGGVATAHPLATQAAIEVLQKGGNAVDAAITASFVLSVVRPQSTGIGGGGFMLVSHDTDVRAFDFRERAPVAATPTMYLSESGEVLQEVVNGQKLGPKSVAGPLAAGTPGLVHGLGKVHEKYGSLPWKDLIAPAIKIAREGFRVNEELARAIERRKDLLKAYPETKKIFCCKKAEEILVQTDLAETLEKIASDGAEAFYKLDLSYGLLTAEDLIAYKTRELDPVHGTVFGHKVYSMPLPSSGGIHLIQMLKLTERLEQKLNGADKAREVHLLSEIARRAFHDRATELGDPLFVNVNAERLYSNYYLGLLADTILSEEAQKSTRLPKSGSVLRESNSTTHLSVVDKTGMAVASTQTINYGFGSGFVAPGTGVLLNNEMDDFTVAPGVPNSFGLVGSEKNFVQPGKTPLSSMTPTIVKNKDGELVAALGSPDGPRIITAVFNVLHNYLRKEMGPGRSVFECRTHHQFIPDAIYLENCIGDSVKEKLKQIGHTIRSARRIGDIQAVFVENNQLTAVSDIRSIGVPEVTDSCQ